jgi:hypothetical protein
MSKRQGQKCAHGQPSIYLLRSESLMTCHLAAESATRDFGNAHYRLNARSNAAHRVISLRCGI